MVKCFLQPFCRFPISSRPTECFISKDTLFFLGCISGWVVGGGLKKPRIVFALFHSRRPQQAIHRNRLKAPNAFFLQILFTFHELPYILYIKAILCF